MLAIQAVYCRFCVVRVSQESQTVAGCLSVLPLDDNIIRLDFEFSVFEELDNFVWSDFPRQSTHLDSSVSITIVECVSQADILILWPIKKSRVRKIFNLLWNSKCLVAAVGHWVDLNPTGTNRLLLPFVHSTLSLFLSLKQCCTETSDSVIVTSFDLDGPLHQFVPIKELDDIVISHLPWETSKLQGYVVVVAN